MKHLIFAGILMALGTVILFWSAYNMLVEQYIYNGPPPIAILVVIPLFIKMYREFNLYKKENNHN